VKFAMERVLYDLFIFFIKIFFLGHIVLAKISLDLEDKSSLLPKLQNCIQNINWLLSRDIDRLDIILSLPKKEQEKVDFIIKIFGSFWSVQNLFF